MFKTGTLPLLIALLLFGAFFTNVAVGAADRALFLNDVQEMLVLFAAALSFTIGVLLREAEAKRKN